MKAKHVSTTIALALGAAALGASSVASAQTVAPPPSPVATETRPNRGMLMMSFLTFGQAYIGSMGIAATSTRSWDANLWIPAVGPWLDLGARPGCPTYATCGNENGYRVLLVVDGALQTFGLCQLVGAFLWPETIPVAKLAGGRGAAVSLAPATVGTRGYGLGAVGRFW